MNEVEKFRSWTDDQLHEVMSGVTEGSHNFVRAKLELERRNQLKNEASASRIETASWIMVVAALLSLAVALIGLFRGCAGMKAWTITLLSGGGTRVGKVLRVKGEGPAEYFHVRVRTGGQHVHLKLTQQSLGPECPFAKASQKRTIAPKGEQESYERLLFVSPHRLENEEQTEDAQDRAGVGKRRA